MLNSEHWFQSALAVTQSDSAGTSSESRGASRETSLKASKHVSPTSQWCDFVIINPTINLILPNTSNIRFPSKRPKCTTKTPRIQTRSKDKCLMRSKIGEGKGSHLLDFYIESDMLLRSRPLLIVRKNCSWKHVHVDFTLSCLHFLEDVSQGETALTLGRRRAHRRVKITWPT